MSILYSFDDITNHISSTWKSFLENKVIVYPTDTLRWIGWIPSVSLVHRIQDIKKRWSHKHMSIIVPSRSWIEKHGIDINIKQLQWYFKLYQWVTYIVRLKPKFALLYHTMWLILDDTIGIRICNHPIQTLVSILWTPIISTSANISWHSNPLQYDCIDSSIIQNTDIIIQWNLLYSKPSVLINMISWEIITRP